MSHLLNLATKQQAGEIFKRMKVSTLVQLVCETKYVDAFFSSSLIHVQIIQVAEINCLDTPKNTDRGRLTFIECFVLFNDPRRILDDIDTARPQTQDSQMSIESTRSTLQR
jgi:hypothetical protein